jgi:hypothetical protein
MEAEIEELGQTIYGRSRSKCLQDKTCIGCGRNASVFNDALSEKEYRISRLCQTCQDKVFGKE